MPTKKESTLAFLAFIADRSFYHELKDRPSDEVLSHRLAELWFEEIYTPSLRYLDSYKGDSEDKKIALFESEFSQDELQALERFHRFFELRLEMLRDPTRLKTLKWESAFWNHLSKDAILALHTFDITTKKRELAQDVFLPLLCDTLNPQL